jgi:oligosaccharide repeat unit polymerase
VKTGLAGSLHGVPAVDYDGWGRPHRRHAVLAATAHSVIVVFVVCLTWLASAIGVQGESLIYPACVVVVLLLAWSFWSWRLATGRFIDPYVLFLLSVAGFNAGAVILEVFRLNKNGPLGGAFSTETTLTTLLLLTIGLGALHFGALLGTASASRSTPVASPQPETLRSIQHSCRITGWACLGASIIPTALLLRDSLALALSSGYLALFQRQIPSGLDATPRILATLLVPGILFLLAGSRGRRLETVSCVVLISAYSLTQFLIGSRGPAVMSLIAFLWLWHRCVRPLRVSWVVLLGTVMLSIVLPLVRNTRGLTGAERLLAGLPAGDGIVGTLAEMGGTLRILAFTVELVPAVRPFDSGASFLYALLTVVPSFLWSVHPSAARGTLELWLVSVTDPMRASLGGGPGFSFLAEAYLNFGWYGVPIVFAVFGFLLARFTAWGECSGNPARMAALASFTSFVLWLPRAETTTIFRSLLWYALVPYFCVLLLDRSRKGGPRTHQNE